MCAVGNSIDGLPAALGVISSPVISGNSCAAEGRKRTLWQSPVTSRLVPPFSRKLPSSLTSVHPLRAPAYASVALPAPESPHNSTPRPSRATHPACTGVEYRVATQQEGVARRKYCT